MTPQLTVCVRAGSLDAIDFLRRFAEEQRLGFTLRGSALAEVRREVFDRGASWETWGPAIAASEERKERPWPDLELERKIREVLPPGGSVLLVPPPMESEMTDGDWFTADDLERRDPPRYYCVKPGIPEALAKERPDLWELRRVGGVTIARARSEDEEGDQ
jgi:hypothetical protein